MAPSGDGSGVGGSGKDDDREVIVSSDDDFEVSDVEETLDEVEKNKKRKEKLKKKFDEKVERRALKLVKEKMKEKEILASFHSVSHKYDDTSSSSKKDPDAISFSSVQLGKVPHFDGNDYSRWKDDMKMYLYGLVDAKIRRRQMRTTRAKTWP